MGGIQTIDVRLEPAHAGLAARPRARGRRADAVARTAEGADPQRRGRSAGLAVRDPALKVKGDEALRVAVPEPAPAHNEPQDIPLTIVFEDEHLLVVDKPAGLVVHPAAGNLDGTLVNALLHHCAGKLSGIGGVARPGIVHRIDKDTSGLLVVAKTDVAHEGLAKAVRGPFDRPPLSGDRQRRSEGERKAPSTRRSPAPRRTARRSRSSKAARQARGHALEAARSR